MTARANPYMVSNGYRLAPLLPLTIFEDVVPVSGIHLDPPAIKVVVTDSDVAVTCEEAVAIAEEVVAYRQPRSVDDDSRTPLYRYMLSQHEFSAIMNREISCTTISSLRSLEPQDDPCPPWFRGKDDVAPV